MAPQHDMNCYLDLVHDCYIHSSLQIGHLNRARCVLREGNLLALLTCAIMQETAVRGHNQTKLVTQYAVVSPIVSTKSYKATRLSLTPAWQVSCPAPLE